VSSPAGRTGYDIIEILAVPGAGHWQWRIDPAPCSHLFENMELSYEDNRLLAGIPRAGNADVAHRKRYGRATSLNRENTITMKAGFLAGAIFCELLVLHANRSTPKRYSSRFDL